jgi:hypothetical protein
MANAAEGRWSLSFDRRHFLASVGASVGALVTNVALPAFSQDSTKERSKMSQVPHIPLTSHHYVEADGVKLFYREAGPVDAPVILLLHGFP